MKIIIIILLCISTVYGQFVDNYNGYNATTTLLTDLSGADNFTGYNSPVSQNGYITFVAASPQLYYRGYSLDNSNFKYTYSTPFSELVIFRTSSTTQQSYYDYYNNSYLGGFSFVVNSGSGYIAMTIQSRTVSKYCIPTKNRADGFWHICVLTNYQNSTNFYIDGINLGSGAGTFSPGDLFYSSYSSQYVLIGCGLTSGSWSQYATGDLQRAENYNRVLTAGEIQTTQTQFFNLIY